MGGYKVYFRGILWTNHSSSLTLINYSVESGVRLVAEARVVWPEGDVHVPVGQHARVVLDISGTRLTDRPAFVEERLLKTRGIVTAEINVFSNRLIVEFDPSIISVDRIKAMIKAAD